MTIGAIAVRLPVHTFVHMQGSDQLRVGLNGCGGRGTGSARNAVLADKGVEIYTYTENVNERHKGGLGLDFRGFDSLQSSP